MKMKTQIAGFVCSALAAFAQANAGDVSPNVIYGQAPGSVDLAQNPSLANAATRQYQKAVELFAQARQPLAGPVDFRHKYVDMRLLSVAETGRTTCPAAMGASFSTGSVADNPSPAPLFPVGVTVDSLEWSENAALAVLHRFLGGVFAVLWPLTKDPVYRACQAPKPILLPTGVAHLNFKDIPMTPQIVPLQLLRIGNLAIAAVPAEVTTMAGRRLKRTALDSLGGAGVDRAVIAGLANSYASYVTTAEEYAMQSYEGASTQFGPDELLAFQQEFSRLGRAMVQGAQVAPGPLPQDVTGEVVNFVPGVVLDDKPLGKQFGDVITQPRASYARGETVVAQFWGGHPRNDLRIQGSFLAVEKAVEGSDAFVPVAHDWDPETVYRWERVGVSYSRITVEWNTADAGPGRYRIRHLGNWKSGWNGKIHPYEGLSDVFSVIP